MFKIEFHPLVKKDLKRVDAPSARRILLEIHEKLCEGSPELVGKSLTGELVGYRRLRVGNYRVVYRVNKNKIEIYVLAIGIRRDSEIYDLAVKRSNKV